MYIYDKVTPPVKGCNTRHQSVFSTTFIYVCMCTDIHILSLIVLVSNIVFRMIRKGNMFFELLMIGSWKVDVPLMKLLNLADFETLLCTLRSCNRKVKQNHVAVI